MKNNYRHAHVEVESVAEEVKVDAIAHNIYADFQNICIEKLNDLNEKWGVESLYDAQENLTKPAFEEYKAAYDALRSMSFYANERRLELQESIILGNESKNPFKEEKDREDR